MRNWLPVLGVFMLLLSLRGTDAPSGFLDREVEIPAEIHTDLKQLLNTGIWTRDNVTLDLSPVQTITVSDGRLSFSPPASVSWRFINTTVTSIHVDHEQDVLVIDVDHSPIDVYIKPEN